METKQLTEEDGKRALLHHVAEKALFLREKYGNFIDYEALLTILKDGDCVRYPARIEFNSKMIDKGFFAAVDAISDDDPAKGYIIYIHEHFKKRLDDVPALALYQVVAINYGIIATGDEAEIYGATALGVKKEEYYQLLCRLVDQIPQ